MKIAFVSSEIYAGRLQQMVAGAFDHLEITDLTYDTYTDAAEVVRARQGEFDGVLFSGSLAYYDCKRRVPEEVPWQLTQHMSSHLATILSNSLRQGFDISSISVDNMPVRQVRSAYQEIGVNPQEVTIYSRHRTATDVLSRGSEEQLEFHRRNYYEHRVTCCFTSTLRCYRALKEQGIPVVFLENSYDSFRHALYALYTRISERSNASSQIVVTIAELAPPHEQSVIAGDRVQYARCLAAMTEKVYAFAERTSALVAANGADQFVLVSTKEDFAKASWDFSGFTLFSELSADLLATTNLGVGYGRSAAGAQANAKRALRLARRKGGNFVCAVSGDGRPLLVSSYLNGPQETAVNVDEKIARLARLAGLSIGKMQRLYRAVSGDEQTAFTSAEIAVRSGLSPRSTDRALMRLENARLARVSGVRSGGTAGRPGRLWSFSFSV